MVGTLDSVNKAFFDGQKIIFFTLLCYREDSIEHDKIECKVTGALADSFERLNIAGSELTVMGRLTTKIYSDGTARTGVSVAHISGGDLFNISDESDRCRLQRIARMYDETEDDTVEWTPEMLEEWDHANREQRAFLRGKYGTPPGRVKEC